MTGEFEIFNIADPKTVCEVPKGTCLLAYRGSIAHGMHDPKPDSIDDIDLMGIVLAPPEHYLGLQEWGSRGTVEYWRGRYDCVFYEIRKMFTLLLQGNPNVMSLLWIKPEHYLHGSAPGRLIVENRNLFVGKHVYAAFAGYASAQLQKMETRDPSELREYIAVTNELKYRGAHPNHKGENFPIPSRVLTDLTGEERNALAAKTEVLLARLHSYQKKGENIGYMGDKRKQLVLEHGYDAKNAAHCVRLLRMCREFLTSGEMTVFRTDASELLDIKHGKWDLERIKKHAEDLFFEVKEARDASTLPAEPDRSGAERLLVKILREHLS